MGRPCSDERPASELSLLSLLCGESAAVERADPDALLHHRVSAALHHRLLAGAFAGVLAVALGVALHSIPLILLAGAVELAYLRAWERASG
jgi:hypothetical protein